MQPEGGDEMQDVIDAIFKSINCMGLLISDGQGKIIQVEDTFNEYYGVKFSISLSLFINFAAILMSFIGWLTPTTGALVHNAGSICRNDCSFTV